MAPSTPFRSYLVRLIDHSIPFQKSYSIPFSLLLPPKERKEDKRNKIQSSGVQHCSPVKVKIKMEWSLDGVGWNLWNWATFSWLGSFRIVKLKLKLSRDNAHYYYYHSFYGNKTAYKIYKIIKSDRILYQMGMEWNGWRWRVPGSF